MKMDKLGIREIPFEEIGELKIGHAADEEAGTGCTVLISEKGMAAAADVRGGGPASRETALLAPLTASDVIHAVVLSGGSAFGLEAGCGVAEFLEEKGIGFETGYAKVPLVCQSCIYDLGVGSAKIRPDKKWDMTPAQMPGRESTGAVREMWAREWALPWGRPGAEWG